MADAWHLMVSAMFDSE